LLSKDKAFKYARVAKFIVGWGSHLYYWVYPGVMVAIPAFFVWATWSGFLYPNLNERLESRASLYGAGGRLLDLRWMIASKGAGASTAVNLGDQRHPDFPLACLQCSGPSAIAQSHPRGSNRPLSTTGRRWQTYSYQFATAKDGTTMADSSGNPLPLLDSAGKPVPFTIDYPKGREPALSPPHPTLLRWFHPTNSVPVYSGDGSPFSSWSLRSSPRWEARQKTQPTYTDRVIASLLITGLVCYLIELFSR